VAKSHTVKTQESIKKRDQTRVLFPQQTRTFELRYQEITKKD